MDRIAQTGRTECHAGGRLAQFDIGGGCWPIRRDPVWRTRPRVELTPVGVAAVGIALQRRAEQE
jgi:hypothetical protein